MIELPRILGKIIHPLCAGYPAILVTGPRQSGKTTLARSAFPDYPYVNFESPVEREDFNGDPMGFLGRFKEGAVLDEAQLVPDLFSYLQVRIDEDGGSTRWILTGSQQLDLSRYTAQSLAGRVSRLELLPLSRSETEPNPEAPDTLAGAVLRGGYPPLYDADRKLDAGRWLDNYLSTFVARDVRAILDVRNRSAFDRFLRLCAARTGQILNTAELARDAAVDSKTASAWLSVLEACYVVRLLRPHFRNFGKRLLKSPKLYFLDSGLAARLLHVSNADQLWHHPLRGALVETWCSGEVLKARLNRGASPNLWFWRSSDGHEVDVVIDQGNRLVPIEIKASATPLPDHARGLRKLRDLGRRDPEVEVTPGLVIYGGDEERATREDRFIPWSRIETALSSFD